MIKTFHIKSMLVVILLIFFLMIYPIEVYARRNADWLCDDGYVSTNLTGNDDCCASPSGGLKWQIAMVLKAKDSRCEGADLTNLNLKFYDSESACTYGLFCGDAYGYVIATLSNSDVSDIKRDDYQGCQTNECLATCNFATGGCCQGSWDVLSWVEYCYAYGESTTVAYSFLSASASACGSPWNEAGKRYWCVGDNKWQDTDPGSGGGGGGSQGGTPRIAPPQYTCAQVCQSEAEEIKFVDSNNDGIMEVDIGSFRAGPNWQKCLQCVCKNPQNENSLEKKGNVWTELGCIEGSQAGLIIFIMRIFVGVVTALAVVRFVQAGFMLNTDDPEKIKEGKSIAVSAVIAIIFGAMIPIILNFIGLDILGIGKIFNIL